MMKVHKDEEVIRWTSDQLQSEISLEVRHLMISHVKGEFNQFEAYVLTNGTDFSTADISLNVKSRSIDTGNSQRDANLRGANFLRADQYKSITFTSTSISQPDGSGRMDLWGDLTLVGITRNIRLEMQMGAPSIDSWGDESACIIITGKIRREDWGVQWTSAMAAEGFVLGDVVIISCRIELVSLAQHDAKRQPDPVALMRAVLSPVL